MSTLNIHEIVVERKRKGKKITVCKRKSGLFRLTVRHKTILHGLPDRTIPSPFPYAVPGCLGTSLNPGLAIP